MKIKILKTLGTITLVLEFASLMYVGVNQYTACKLDDIAVILSSTMWLFAFALFEAANRLQYKKLGKHL